jgi:monofunctional biosynthetic peptidoglycan transglycosylase
MGDGIYGAQAAAKYYFHKDAKNLSQSEAAAIAAVLPNPRKWRPDKPTGYIQKRKNKIIRQINNLQGAVTVY